MEKLISDKYFNTWKSMLDTDIDNEFSAIRQKELEPHSFTFYTSVSVMSSSKIEGESLELDSYVKHKLFKTEYLTELTEKPNDLYTAYLFASNKKLTHQNFLEAHTLITAHLLPEKLRATIRINEMLLLEHNTGLIQYEACPVNQVEKQYNLLWKEIENLLQQEMSIYQIFYYAAFIHLIFVNIHPFSDCNGRISRLLEKWFLYEKLGYRAWFIQSEKYYYKNIDINYKNLARLGMFYQELDYDKAIPFLLMLPLSLIFEKRID